MPRVKPSPSFYISPSPAPDRPDRCIEVEKCYRWLKYLVEKELKELTEYVTRELAEKGVEISVDAKKGMWIVVEPDKIPRNVLNELLELYEDMVREKWRKPSR